MYVLVSFLVRMYVCVYVAGGLTMVTYCIHFAVLKLFVSIISFCRLLAHVIEVGSMDLTSAYIYIFLLIHLFM